MKKYTIYSALISLFLLVGNREMKATHFLGVSMSYECLGTCDYRVYHESYYDCSGAATVPLPGPPLAPSVQFGPGGCTPPVALGPWILEHYVEITPVCPGFPTWCTTPNAIINGILEARFYRDYNYCNASCTDITWASCCRNTSITSGGANQGIHLSMPINTSVSPCNSSPQFTSSPYLYLCIGQSHTFSQGAYDPDGDSLVFSLGPCYTAPNTPVTYLTGSSPTQPLGWTWGTTIDPATGDLTFTPFPGNLFVGVMCIYVEEYRNGALIGTISRDVQVAVVQCAGTSNAPTLDTLLASPTATLTGPTSIETCPGNIVTLTITASDADPMDPVFISTNVDRVFPGAVVNVTGTNPVQADITFQADTTGTYGFHVQASDSSCPIHRFANRTYIVRVTNDCISAQITPSACATSQGAIDITVWGGTAPYTYLWSTGATTEDISGLAPGAYTVTVTDANNYVFSRTFWVNAANIQVNATVAHPTCNLADGSIQTQVSGATPPYTYLWNTGDTTSGISSLPPGGYSVTILDSTGCPFHLVEILNQPDSCFNIIEGVAYADLNQNCIQDPNEPGLPNLFIDLTPGPAAFTDSNGYYKFRVDTGAYVVDLAPRPFQTPLCPSGGSHMVNFQSLKQDTTLDFAIDFVPVQDLRIGLLASRARPGFQKFSNISVQNDGSIPMTAQVDWTHDPLFSYVNAYPPPAQYDPNTQTVSWNLSQTLAPGQTFWAIVQVQVDTSTALGTLWTESATVMPIVGDTTPGNNTTAWTDTVRGAFDPNDKQVFPTGIREPGYIEPTQDLMQYIVRFQNTGTDTAFYVVIRDTIDADLEISSFLPGTESHPYQLTVEEDSILVFTFANILLPDSGTNLIGSNGHVSFYLRHNGTLSPGTVIENSAAIYFDFNAPIITNTVTNTVFTYPIVSLGGDTTICEGQPLAGQVISAGMPPYDFAWTTGDTDPGNIPGISQTTVSASGVYGVSVTDAFGFVTTDTIQVVAAPLPDAAFTFSGMGNIYDFSAISMANTSWQWIFGDGDTLSGSAMVSHTYLSGGTYTVTLITENDCGSDTSQQVVDFSTGIEEKDFSTSIQIHPNPFISYTWVSFANPGSQPVHLTVFDKLGHEVQQYQTTGRQVRINGEGLAKGIYLIRIEGEYTGYGRIIVK